MALASAVLFAVMAGLVYSFLPFMILPIYASLERIDPSLLEAASVEGAGDFQAVALNDERELHWRGLSVSSAR